MAGIDSAEPAWTRRRALIGGVSLLALSGCSGLDFNLPGIGRPGAPTGPALRRMSTVLASISSAGSSMRADSSA